MNHITKLLEKVNTESFKDIQTRNYPAYVGMDTHKDTIVVSIAIPGRTKPKHLGTIANDPKKIAILVKNISKKHNDEVVLFCYEAGPCGYILYHQITSLGACPRIENLLQKCWICAISRFFSSNAILYQMLIMQSKSE